MDSSPPTAPELSIGFALGLYTRDDISDWVTLQLPHHEPLPAALLDLTTLAGKHDVEIEHHLRDLAGAGANPDPKTHATLTLRTLARMLRRDRITARDAIGQATRHAEAISFDLYGETIGLEDAYDTAVAGIYGSVDDARRDIEQFFAQLARDLESVAR